MKASKKNSKPYQYDMYRDGVTQSMIRLWLTCPTQARFKYLEGWTAIGNTPPYFIYGSIVHWCLEKMYAQSSGWPKLAKDLPRKYAVAFQKLYPQKTGDVEGVNQWAQMAQCVLPHYVKRCCMKSPLYGDQNKRWLGLEEVVRFDFPMGDHTIPVVGKLDAVFEHNNEIWLLDTKTSARVDPITVLETLPHDIQMMTYLWLLSKKYPTRKIGGCIYNIASRPSLRQRKDEPWEDFCQRCGEDVEARPDEYFSRFEMRVTKREIQEWANNHLEKWLRQMDIWFYRQEQGKVPDSSFHYYNPDALITRYGQHCEMYNMIVRNNTRGYFKRETPFPELELEI